MTASTRFSRLWLPVALGLYLAGLVGLTHLIRRPWGDEGHFIDTIRLFASGTVGVRDYPEMAGPLPFLLYAGWGHVAGFSLPGLRLMTVLLAGATILTLVRLVRTLLPGDDRALGWILGLTLLNPYTVGLSAFVFTDQLMWLGLMVGLLLFVQARPTAFGVVSALGLVARLYLVFLPAGVGLAALIRYLLSRDRRDGAMLLAAILSLGPILYLMHSWGGVGPPAGRARWLAGPATAIHLHYLTLYLALPAVYLGPLLVYLRRTIYRDRAILLVSAGLTLLYPLAPVRPSAVTLIQTDLTTVGLFHRLIERLLPPVAVDGVFALALLASLPMWLTLFGATLRTLRRTRRLDLAGRLDCVLLVYLMLMPISYSVWEKYFIPIIPVLALRLFLEARRDRAAEPVNAR